LRTWQTAGYDVFLRLALMRLSLDEQPKAPDHLVVEGEAARVNELLAIDAPPSHPSGASTNSD
jgi:hypothetical protein